MDGVTGYGFKGHHLTSDEWARVHLFWHLLSIDYIFECFGDPKKSFFWVCVDNREHAFAKGMELAKLRNYTDER